MEQQQMQSSAAANVVEEEPPSDFYADLCGRRRSSPSGKRRKLLPATDAEENTTAASAAGSSIGRRQQEAPSDRSIPVVPVVPKKDDGGDDIRDTRTKEEGGQSGGKSEMARALHRAFSDPPQLSSLSLDKSNKGYALLSRMGWAEEGGGLGKRRQGDLEPVKTQLKRDKKGIGARKSQTRITHRPHEDTVESTGENLTKAERKRLAKQKAEKEALKDKRARMLVSSDIPPEYEDLYMNLHR